MNVCSKCKTKVSICADKDCRICKYKASFCTTCEIHPPNVDMKYLSNMRKKWVS